MMGRASLWLRNRAVLSDFDIFISIIYIHIYVIVITIINMK